MKPLKGSYGLAFGALIDGARIVTWPLRPIFRLPRWLRVPVSVGVVWGVTWVVEWVWARR